jgi:hypothetical protein
MKMINKNFHEDIFSAAAGRQLDKAVILENQVMF